LPKVRINLLNNPATISARSDRIKFDARLIKLVNVEVNKTFTTLKVKPFALTLLLNKGFAFLNRENLSAQLD
jgi:hypothetical protein